MTRAVVRSLVAVASLVVLVGAKLEGQPAGMPSTKPRRTGRTAASG